ncbi:hypothetical protein Dalk_2122 [Desulfatibacillum aliphaticivorans]|uniref:Uncharacterized protein n=1 Tax=Desulfatibacillum aliphaticivorans TaxID=218208 RepID=B8FGD6_DESAL|nr:hypothetical protein [Desulfatibacillum aliphaticivorans]ACL03816.1 hypothetical protein Dalk_2122 [Desulfatibacillum aliphaticivorans]
MKTHRMSSILIGVLAGLLVSAAWFYFPMVKEMIHNKESVVVDVKKEVVSALDSLNNKKGLPPAPEPGEPGRPAVDSGDGLQLEKESVDLLAPQDPPLDKQEETPALNLSGEEDILSVASAEELSKSHENLMRALTSGDADDMDLAAPREDPENNPESFQVSLESEDYTAAPASPYERVLIPGFDESLAIRFASEISQKTGLKLQVREDNGKYNICIPSESEADFHEKAALIREKTGLEPMS